MLSPTELGGTALDRTPHSKCTERGAAVPACKRILIVDDIDANRLMLQIVLEKQGLSVTHARSGDEAIRLAAASRYDAILMDIHMPVTDGYTAARLIREGEHADERTLIIAVTACVGNDVRERCFESGMDAYFTKPLELQKFCGSLLELLDSRR